MAVNLLLILTFVLGFGLIIFWAATRNRDKNNS